MTYGILISSRLRRAFDLKKTQAHYNHSSLSTERHIDDDYVRVSVLHDGHVFMRWQEKTTFRCALNMADFPFDTQICNQTFVPWTYPSLEVCHERLHSAHCNQSQVILRYWSEMELEPILNNQGQRLMTANK